MASNRLLVSLLLVSCALWGQNGKRPLRHTDYDGWKNIAPQVLSRDGKWLAYGLFPQDGDGELVLLNLATGAEIRKPAGAIPTAPLPDNPENPEAPPPARTIRIAFTADAKFVVATTFPPKSEKKGKNGLLIVDVSTGQETRVADVASMQVPESGDYVAYLKGPKSPAPSTDAPKPAPPAVGDAEDQRGAGRAGAAAGGASSRYGSDLVLRALETAADRTFEDVSEYSFAKDGKTLVYSVSSRKEETNGVYAVTPGVDGTPAALLAGKGKYTRPTWDRGGRQLAFLSSHGDGKTFAPYLWDRKASAAVALKGDGGLQPGYVFVDRGQTSFSWDGSRVFFPVMTEALAAKATPPAERPAAATDGEERVVADLWHWKDDYIQPMQKIRAAQDRTRTYRAVYHLGEKKLLQLADPTMLTVSPSDDGRWAIGNDDRKYRSMVDYDGTYADLYLVDALTGGRQPLIEKYRGAAAWSPKGNYVLVFKKGDWWSVRISDRFMTNLTGTLGVKFANELHDSPSEAASYGNGGWTKDGAGVLLYDMYDVWYVSADGRTSRRLTKGREQKVAFRVTRLDGRGGGPAFGPPAPGGASEDEEEERGLDPAKPLFLRAENEVTRETGIYRVANLTGASPEQLIWGAVNYRVLGKSHSADVVVLSRSTFEEEPNLWITDSAFRSPRQVTHANPQKAGILWGTGELMAYKNADGVALQAALYKPENFDPKKKYPLMVYIYERLSQGVHTYVPPRPGTSINISYYVSNGYLVLTPDIVYTVGSPGQSALKCVLPAIQELVDRGFVDESAIGIQGHSWGGYQIAYMVTRTSRFRAAEAGAPVGNMTSAYNGIRWGTGLPRQFQYEKTQSRIGGTLWDAPLDFIENSAVFRANRVNTPLLMIADDDDDAVPWYQGIELFLSLRRNGKEAYLFNYNGEKHGLRHRQNQKDYTVRMQQFFDHFLKGAPAPEWMEKGIPYNDREEEKKRFSDAAYGAH